jgi:hypothetical protein
MTRRLALAISCFLVSLTALGAACGDGAPADPTAPAGGSPAGTVSTVAGSSDRVTQPDVKAPASQYSLLLDDVGLRSFLTDIPATYELDAAKYADSKVFDTVSDGVRLLNGWGYTGGYETGMWPEGREQAMLNGAYRILQEVHLFQTAAGAKGFYDYAVDRVKKAAVGQPVQAPGIGNESSSFYAVQGTIRSSRIGQAIHQVIFRRGNMVAVVQTVGAESFMKVDTVIRLALMIDDKALGKTPAVAPTPTSNFTPASADRSASAAAATVPAPTPTGTPGR